MESKIKSIISDVISEIAEEREFENFNPNSEDQRIFGGRGPFDSLAVVLLISELESRLAEELDINVILADDQAMSMRTSPFRDIGRLTRFVIERAKESD